ncbi:MAG TPA: methyltransferase domain-containing protein [Nitrososphaerales archaeon]|nr:methyltransferase domain-containing protein [Nitrososphaerales archaeon]
MTESRRSAQRFFAKHASGYAKSSGFAHGADLEALVKALKPAKTDLALDVATGTGFTAFSLAPLVRSVVGVDITDGMLRQARRLAKVRRAGNVTFERGDALRLGYPDASFDIVTTRRATHHFADVPAFLHEAKRVLRPAGRLGIVDMSPPRGATDFANHIEKLRDSSHARAFDPAEWRLMLDEADLEISSELILEEAISLGDWLYPVEAGGKEEEAVRTAWKSASTRVRRLLKAVMHDGVIRGWTKHRIVLVAMSETP